MKQNHILTRKCLLFAVFLALPLLQASSAAISFVPEAPRNSINFDTLVIGSPVSTIGWTGPGVSDVLGAAPRTGNPSDVALQADASTTRRVITSPLQTVTPKFTTSDTVYFSGWFNRFNSASSGARVQIRGANGTDVLGGFGVSDTSGNAFAMYAGGQWHTSAELASTNTWYEIALVVSMNAADITQSLGYLFVRNVSAGDTEFHLITDLSGINMGYTSDFNGTDFSYWRIENFRYNAQVDNLAAGIGVVSIPEPKTAALQGVMIFVAVIGYMLHGRRKQGQQ